MNEPLNNVLDVFRPAFKADGFDLALGTVQSGVVVVRVLHGPEACDDCLMPDDRLGAMLKNAFEIIMPDLSEVILKHETHNKKLDNQ